MLSSAKIGRSSWRYYQRTVAGGACEYYAERGDTPGRWHGSGLSELGLSPGARVEERELEALFGRGLCPATGEALGRAWRPDAVTGYDLTFSAPKSVSALWALGDADTMAAIQAAHAGAVDAALGFLEGHASLSRRGRDGVEQVGSSGFAAACFDHSTSRTGDPQLHTHALVVNKVRCTDGVWRTLDGHEVYHHKKAAGVVYQTALRAELTERLPVSFGAVSVHGQAEIVGVPEQLLAAWSTRTGAVMAEAVPTIAEAEAALGRPVSAAERARIIKTAVLATRPVKDAPVPEGDRRERWAAQATALGWTAEAVTDSVRAAHPATDPATRTLAARDVGVGWMARVTRESVSEVGARKAIWSRADLTTALAARIPASDSGGPRTGPEVVALVEHLADTTLADVEVAGAVPLGLDPSGVTLRASDDRYASAELVQVEARILERVIAGGFQLPSRMNPEFVAAAHAGAGIGLSEDQGRAVVRLLASRDLVTVMTAPAGAGKTTTLGAAVTVWRANHTDVVALAPSARAAGELGAATGTGGQTVARWLLTQTNTPTGGRSPDGVGWFRQEVILVDEASMLSTSDLDQLTAHAATRRARLVLVGDPAQIGAVNTAGGMFEHLTHTLGPRTIELSELHRFTQAWEAAATLRLRDGDPGVLDTYLAHDRIHPAASSQDAADAVFDQWRTATEGGQDALMLARAWTDVNALNARARAVAIATGAVTGGDLALIATRSASTQGHLEHRAWRAGDVLLAKKNNTTIPIGDQTLRNGDRFRVTAATDTGALVVTDLRGRGETTLPAGYLAKHAEYGWAATIDAAQGATADIGIVLARSGLDRERLYVAMSRGRADNHIHTTPETSTGDAGPHRRPSPDGVDGQLSLPDHQAALALLRRAVATSGRERAAHSLLDPPVAGARETAWQAAQDTRPPPALPHDHQRRRDQLTAARQQRDADAAHITALHAALTSYQGELDGLPFWSRGRRQQLTADVDRTHTVLDVAQARLTDTDTTISELSTAVGADTVARELDARQDRARRHHEWTTRPQRPYPDPNDNLPAGPAPSRNRAAEQRRVIRSTPGLDRYPGITR